MSADFKLSASTFDEYSAEYDAALTKGIRVSGENKFYFASGRIDFLKSCLAGLGETPERVLDFGCGVGTAAPYLLALPATKQVLGIDVSPRSLEVARKLCTSERASFQLLDAFKPAQDRDLAFCNGVFHHIPPHERASAIKYVHGSLRPGGLFALWDNNPWNPGAMYVMKKIPFDHDAVPLSCTEAAAALRTGGFEIVRTDFMFIFPKLLKALRGIEPLVSRLPLGAQYQVLARRKR